MDRLLEFIGNHPIIVGGVVAVVAAIIANEVMNFLQSTDAVDPDDATRLYNRENAVFVDLRGENAYHTAHLPGAVNIPANRLEQQTKRLERFKGKPLIVYGEPGRGQYQALKQLKGMGLEPVYQLRGGLAAWQEASLPMEGRG